MKGMNSNIKWLPLVAALVIAGAILIATPLEASEKWPGVDEVVVEKIAAEHGREASSPLIDTDQGDLLLFLFLLAGAIAGFVAGYYWHTLMTVRITTTGNEKG